MKNFIFSLLGLLFCSVLAFAQSKTVIMPINKATGVAYSYASTSVSGTNSISAFTSADNISGNGRYLLNIYPNIDNAYGYYIGIKLDSISGTDYADSVTLEGKMFEGESSWTSISVKKWTGTSKDTTIYFDGKVLYTLSGSQIFDTTKVSVSPGALYQSAITGTYASKTAYRILRIRIKAKNQTQVIRPTALYLKFIKE